MTLRQIIARSWLFSIALLVMYQGWPFVPIATIVIGIATAITLATLWSIKNV